jgi:hypothetical protein
MVLTEGLLARSAVPPPWPSACVFQSPYISKIEHLWRRGRMHQGGRKTWHIEMTLFGLYLIRYQPHLSIFESFWFGEDSKIWNRAWDLKRIADPKSSSNDQVLNLLLHCRSEWFKKE